MTVIKIRRALFAVLVGLALVATACGSDSDSGDKASTSVDETTTTEASSSGESETTLPAGAQPGFDDYNGDGEPEPTCGTHDYGAGLVLRVWCDAALASGYAPEAPEGVTLVKDSLFRLPGPPGGGELPGFEGMSGSTLQARDVDGNKVVIVTFSSDSLFETGSAQINSDSLDAVIRGVNQHYPGSRVQVRGHTDSTGSAATNQTLSEQRAKTVQDYLQSHGLKAIGFASIGVASRIPLAEERKPDGSVSDEGQKFNRRVEIVVTVPKA
jgi:OmpA-OmpF porin, OOP family